MLDALTAALGVDRQVLAVDDQIDHAWGNLPRLLGRIPAEHRNETLARMCVAVASGLFDSAINYAWNAAVVELRQKVRRFGLNVIPQIIGKQFDEAALVDLKDVELLQLCLKLNLISEDGFFLLDQCRAIRNNFSAAHPSMGVIDEDELLSFLNRVARHALSNERNLVGVDIPAFLAALKLSRFSADQLDAWKRRLLETFDAQREMLFGTLHGMYCDPASGEEARVNAIGVCQAILDVLTPNTKSTLVDRHQDYVAKGEVARHTASQQFFERLGLLSLLGEAEVHLLITKAAQSLMSVHQDYNNFYNEPPFAERLLGLTSQNRVPESAQHAFVEALATAATGSRYGVSNGAYTYYVTMVKSLSPAEVSIFLELPLKQTILASRLYAYQSCRDRFKALVKMIDPATVPTQAKAEYAKWII
ncbi:hypothetical protein ACNFJ7_05190 [Sphingomonas sp. HT-1]|uniref:hypothetical protein n=1 Tax=unclassified Sphingomonas TaxID=196159 RepID=UPI0009E7143A|nr:MULTISPECIES: hypothetical protein [unclassified Sphingomonas]